MRQLTTGEPVPADDSHTKLRADGQQEGYVVLSPEERAKGFVKAVRRSYIHVGAQDRPENLRDLTADEHARYDKFGYVKFEPYGQDRSPITGKYWTQLELDRAGRRCGSVTTMGQALAETYARDPNFYSGTFCCNCGKHFPLAEFTWSDGEPMDTSLQAAWAAERDARIEARRQLMVHELEKAERAELARLKAKYPE